MMPAGRNLMRHTARLRSRRDRWLLPVVLGVAAVVLVLVALPPRSSAEVNVGLTATPPGSRDLATTIGSAGLLGSAARAAGLDLTTQELRHRTAILQHGPDVTTATLVASGPHAAELVRAWAANARYRLAKKVYPYRAWIRRNRPTAWWQLNDRGRIAKDSSGHGLSGRWVRDVVLPVRVGAFDGAGVGRGRAFVVVSGPTQLAARRHMTIEAWIRGDQLLPPRAQAGIVSKWKAFFLRLRGAPDGTASVRFAVHRRPGWAVVEGERFRLSKGGAHHIVGTYDGRRLHLYADGRLVGETRANGAITPSAYQLEIGRSGAYFKGGVAQVAFYTHVLPASAIEGHYATGSYRLLRVGDVVIVKRGVGQRVAAAVAFGILLAAVVVALRGASDRGRLHFSRSLPDGSG
jgi:hypothetical protein